MTVQLTDATVLVFTEEHQRLPITWGEFCRENRDTPDEIDDAYGQLLACRRALLGGGASPEFTLEWPDDGSDDNGIVRPTDGDAPISAWDGKPMSPFMAFWEDLNAVFARHNLPEILYGEARDLFRRRYSDTFGDEEAMGETPLP